MAEGPLVIYERIYANMKTALEVVRETVQRASGLTQEDLLPLVVVKIAREKLLRLFSAPELVKICRQCGGACCSRKFSYMNWNELFYLLGTDPGFRFPEPDWEYLAKSLNCCIFLSDMGCLLRDNRPNRCLFYVCKRQRPLVPVKWIRNRTEMGLLESTLKWHLNLWCQRIVGEERILNALLYLNVAQYIPVKGASGDYEPLRAFSVLGL